CRHHLLPPLRGHHHLDAPFGHPLVPAHLPDRRVGAVVRGELSGAGHRPGAAGVVPHGTGSGCGERAAQLFGVLFWYVHHEHVQGLTGGGHQGAGAAQVEGGGECLVHPAGGDVGVGVGHVQGHTGGDEAVHHPPFGTGGGHRVHRFEQQRVVGDEQVGAGGGSLGDHLLGGVDGEQHAFDRGHRVADHQADGVPGFGGGGRVAPLQEVDHVTQVQRCVHASNVSVRTGWGHVHRAATAGAGATGM